MSRTRAWVVACRPRTLTAAVAPVAAGTGLAHMHGGFVLLAALAALAVAMLVQIGTNLANDYYDYQKGGDDEGRLGPVRVTQAGLIEGRDVLRGAFLAFGLSMGAGVYLGAVAGWPMLAIGAACIASGIAYTGGPWPLGYHGLGDLFVFVFFGLVAVAGTSYVQLLEFRPDSLTAGVALGAASTAILVVNNLRDMETDARAGKRTLAVRVGTGWTKAQYAFLLALTAAVPPLGMAVHGWSPWVLLSLFALPAVVGSLRLVLTFREPAALNRALAGTARFLGLFGLLLGLGFALG
jgi:1,4-dihydroxy-2-naphthoate octaprenyltransferase